MLINKDTKKEIKIGDTVANLRGEKCVVTDIADLVYVKTSEANLPYGVYMSVINAEWVE